MRDGFWLEFWAGNNGDTSESNPAWAHPASSAAEMQQFRSGGEIAYLAQKHELSLRYLAAHPAAFAGPFPSPRSPLLDRSLEPEPAISAQAAA